MTIKRIIENKEAKAEIEVDLPQNKEPVASYLRRLSQAARSEQETLREYQMILDCPDLPNNVRDAVNEIMEDEKDHMVIFASLACLELSNNFPKNGDINPYTGLEEKGIDYASIVLGEEENKEDEPNTVTEASKLKRKKIKRDKIKESVEVKELSSDNINYTTTYEVTVDIKVEPGNILKAKVAMEDAIFEMNEKDENLHMNLTNFTDDSMSYTLKIPEEDVLDGDAVTAELFELADSDYIELV